MKYLIFSLCISLTIAGCTKNSANQPDPPPGNINYTIVPPLTPVNTSLMVYALGNSQVTNPVYINHNGIDLNYSAGNDGFTTNGIITDKYMTSLALSPSLSYNFGGSGTFKVFTVSNSIRNYADIKILSLTHLGGFNYDDGSGTFPMPYGGVIDLPPFSLGAHPGAIAFGVSSAYLHPSINDYAVSLPCYAMGDDGGKRWFLNSYGIYFLVPEISNVADQNIDFNAAVNVSLKLSVSPDQLSTAPDSIAVWNINSSHVWQKNGYAHKTGSYYETHITHRGFWNFAVPSDAVYLVVHLRTTTGASIMNTRFKIKNAAYEIADTRTDADGNATVFIPVKTDLNIEVVNDHFNNWSTLPNITQHLGTFNSASEKSIVVADRIDLPVIEGTVYNCDGSLLANGQAVLSNAFAKDNYIFPITNGKFKGSTWINYGFNLADLSILDNAGNILTNNKFILGSGLPNSLAQNVKHYNVNFYSCLNAEKLYSNFTLDTTSYSIAADAGASGKTLTETDYPSGLDIITIDDNGQGISFQGSFHSVLGNYYSNGGIVLPSGLKVNGTVCQFEGDSEIAITRRDAAAGGYLEGWFLIYYKDNNNVSHKITGNFRLKRTN